MPIGNASIAFVQDAVATITSPPPVGEVAYFAGEDAPQGWMIRNGASFDGNKWPDLAKVLKGTTLPDDRGLFLRGYDPAGTNDIDGATRKIGSFQEGSVLVGGWGWDVSGLTTLSSPTYEKGIASVGWDKVRDTSVYYRAVDIPGGQLAWSNGGLSQNANGTNNNEALGIARPKNRNYLPIIYAGPEIQT